MTATPTGIALLSCLRRLGSTSELLEISERYFIEEEELNALRWLRDYVREHRAFPGVLPFRGATGISPVVTREPISYYKSESRRRALYREASRRWNRLRDSFESKNPDETIAVAKEIAGLESMFQSGNSEIPFADFLNQVAAESLTAMMTPGLRGINTGYEFLDDETNGWQNTDNIALVGRISDGKTYVALKHAMSAWIDGRKSVLFQSNEMSQLQIARRMIGMYSRINPRNISTGQVSTVNRSRMVEGISAMSNGIPFHCYAGSLSASTRMLRVLCERHRPDIIFVDASYLLTPEKKGISRRENLVDVANDLKVISLDYNRPLLHTVQFNRTAVRGSKERDSQADAPPASPISQHAQVRSEDGLPARDRHRRYDFENVSHLGLHKIAETDAIAANASIVIGLARPRGMHYNTRRYYYILKGREGENGLWMINYNFQTMDFSEITEAQEEQENEVLTSHMR